MLSCEPGMGPSKTESHPPSAVLTYCVDCSTGISPFSGNQIRAQRAPARHATMRTYVRESSLVFEDSCVDLRKKGEEKIAVANSERSLCQGTNPAPVSELDGRARWVGETV